MWPYRCLLLISVDSRHPEITWHISLLVYLTKDWLSKKKVSQFTPQPSTCVKYVSGLTIQINVVSPVDDNKNNNSGLALGIISVRSFPDVSQLIVFSDPVLIMWVPCQEKVLK